MATAVVEKEQVTMKGIDVTAIVETLLKGDTLTQKQMEVLFGVKRGKTGEQWKRFDLLVMQLQGVIQQRLFAQDKLYTVVMNKGDIHICTDREASTYHRNRHQSLCRAIRKSSTLNKAVDTSGFSSEEKHTHDNTVMKQTMLVQEMQEINAKMARRERLGLE